MLHDVDFFESRLNKIDGFGDTAEQLLKIIRAKEIRNAAPSPAPPAAGPSEPKGGNAAAAQKEEVKPNGEAKPGEAPAPAPADAESE